MLNQFIHAFTLPGMKTKCFKYFFPRSMSILHKLLISYSLCSLYVVKTKVTNLNFFLHFIYVCSSKISMENIALINNFCGFI